MRRRLPTEKAYEGDQRSYCFSGTPASNVFVRVTKETRQSYCVSRTPASNVFVRVTKATRQAIAFRELQRSKCSVRVYHLFTVLKR